jgi:hypothetical protein
LPAATDGPWRILIFLSPKRQLRIVFIELPIGDGLAAPYQFSIIGL